MTRLRNRRGSALILVLLMTLAVAALAVAAIFMSGSASLLSRFYDKERQFAYAAQSGIDRVISRLHVDSAFVIDGTTPTLVLDQVTLENANGTALAGVTVRVWGARTGDTTSTGPITISLLAQVSDASGTRFVRRTDLRRLHFGQWALIANTGNSSDDPFENSAFVAGRVHANANWSTITQVSYRDSVTSTGTFGTTNAANLRTGKGESQRRIPWPDADTLLARLSAAAVSGTDTLRFDVSGTNPARAELVWIDLDTDGVADREEGFIRVFELEGSSAWGFTDRIDIRSETMVTGPNTFVRWDEQTIQNQCGAFYRRNGVWQFFPVASHRAPLLWAIIDSTAATPARPAGANSYNAAAARAVLTLPTARCFPSGSPYLVNTERFTDNGGNVGFSNSHNRPFGTDASSPRYGGQDTTFTATIRQCSINSAGTQCLGGTIYEVGTWRTLSNVAGREYLAPLDRAGRGAVVYFDDDIRLSGRAAGRITVAVDGNVRIVDHLTLAGEPDAAGTDCQHLLGVVAESYIRIEESLVAHRSRVGSGSGGSQNSVTMLGGTDHFPLHGAMLSLESYFGLEGNDFRQANSNTWNCEGTAVSAGCIRHFGSAAMHRTREFRSGSSQGGRYVLTPDACMETVGFRPPFFPATNRYRVLRSVDVRPASIIGVNAIANYFATLQGTSDIP